MLVPVRIHTELTGELDKAVSKRGGKKIDETRFAGRITIPAGRYGTVNEFAAFATFYIVSKQGTSLAALCVEMGV